MRRKKKKRKLQTFDLPYFLGRNVFGDDGAQNYLIFQLLHDTLKRLTGTKQLLPGNLKVCRL